MFDDSQGFLKRAFLEREWALDYKAWRGSDEEAALLGRLRSWAARPDLRERSAVAPFVQTFFVDTWGYEQAGRAGEWTAYPEYSVPGAGAGGAAGSADLALGWFADGPRAIPQVLCEFKDIRSSLDAPQPRKGNNRSPVRQCMDYVAGVRRQVFPNEPIQAWWGLVSDMNEFRLYWWDRPQEYLRFVIQSRTPLVESSMIDETEGANFDRFVFARLFQRDRLLSRGGRPPLLRAVDRQVGREKELEGEFYADYKGVREALFEALRAENPAYADSPGRLLRLAQKILDRFIFAFYCEDMGERMLFPPQLIKDTLIERSRSPLFDPRGDDLWSILRGLFRTMDTGGPFGQLRLRAFNGGLFRHDPEVDSLRLPNAVFCQPGQGANDASIKAHKATLLHLCGSYNYAARGAATESIGLYTLGRIFEQSITELEVIEARLERRPSLNVLAKRKLPKRKRDGVYYTPEWVVNRIVEGVLGPWLAAAKAACSWPGESPATLDQLETYRARVEAVRVVDPACGSGAFLIGAFRRLLRERREIESFRAELQPGAMLASEAALTASILDRNLHGVDISGPAVEIAKLALWLHSARSDAPLSSLDGAIKCGNSLIDSDFYRAEQHDAFGERQREQVNAFDWKDAFPFGGDDPGRFDIVLGNPPYVKLQNLRKVDPEVATYLTLDREGGYASTQTGNYDLYLPFIEKGLRLLRTGGRMGYIAPSLWTVNEYGEGLRRLVRDGRHLERWVDFKSHQIFDEAITYTALQFYTTGPNAGVEVVPAPDGEKDLAEASTGRLIQSLSYERLPAGDPWLLATGEERALIDRLNDTCLRLDDRSLTSGIIVGIQTSADSIYHLERLGENRYRCTPNDGDPKNDVPHTPPYEVNVEDAIMKPLVSGPEAKRYEEPSTNTYVLFPYERDAVGRIQLIRSDVLDVRFPNAWSYLKSYEDQLRQREDGKFDDNNWFRFGRSQNIDKQDLTKLIVPRLVRSLKSALDLRGHYVLDNVDVGGVTARSRGGAAYLNGVLNGPVANFTFQRISKPFLSGYFSANRQFIAPLPVPDAGRSERASVARAARRLQRSWTVRRGLLRSIGDRLDVVARTRFDVHWLWPDLPQSLDFEGQAPGRLHLARERREWAREKVETEIGTRRAAFAADLARGGRLEVAFDDGELRLLSGGAPILSRIYLAEDLGRLIAAYWRWLLLTGHARDAESFEKALTHPPTAADTPAADQFIERVTSLTEADAAIAREEIAMNDMLAALYRLTPEERRLIEAP